jgi:hypothetical protein
MPKRTVIKSFRNGKAAKACLIVSKNTTAGAGAQGVTVIGFRLFFISQADLCMLPAIIGCPGIRTRRKAQQQNGYSK